MNFPPPVIRPRGEHSRFGASSSARWAIGCAASVRLQSGLPDETSAHALAGTHAHAWLELFLSGGLITDTAGYVGLSHPEDAANVIDADTARVMAAAVEFVASRLGPDDELFIEKTWAAPAIHAECFGTADVIIRKPNGDVTVIDYKNGSWQVPVAGNTQLMQYGLSARGPGGTVTGFILQRARTWELSIRSHVFTEADLQGYLFSAQMAVAEELTAKPTPGKHCKYCRALPTCSGVGAIIDDIIAAPTAVALTPETAPEALTRAAAAEAYAAAVQAQAMAMASRGTPPVGYKLVAGRSGHREWSDPAAPRALEGATGVKLHSIEWLSPAQAEKALGAKHKSKVAPLLAPRKPGAPKLVPLSADGDDITPKPQSGFGVFVA